MKLSLIAVLIVCMFLPSCCTWSVAQKASGKPYDGRKPNTQTKEANPAYWALTPFAIAADIVTSPFQVWGAHELHGFAP